MDQAQIDTMVTLGEKDANSENANATQDTFHYFAMKKNLDNRLQGVSFAEFRTRKAAGHYDADYSILEDKKMQQFFLQ